MATTCPQACAGTRSLVRVAIQTTSSVTAPAAAVSVRMLSGGISTSAIFITGQVTPQSRHSATSISLA